VGLWQAANCLEKNLSVTSSDSHCIAILMILLDLLLILVRLKRRALTLPAFAPAWEGYSPHCCWCCCPALELPVVKE